MYNARIFLVDGRKFLVGMRHENVCFALVPKKTDNSDYEEEQLEEIKVLLIEYGDIISTDVPDGLPPMRSINHCMDLIPRASLPNKVAHQMTPTKNEELNR